MSSLRTMDGKQKNERAVQMRKVEGHDVAVAVWSRDPNLGVTVCGEWRWMSCDWLWMDGWMEERGSKSWWWNGSGGGRIQV